jgi:hypothetical protein
MSEAGRSIDIRFHSIKQDYIDGNMRIGGVSTHTNQSDLCTKYLAVVPHLRHASPLLPPTSPHGVKAAELLLQDDKERQMGEYLRNKTKIQG